MGGLEKAKAKCPAETVVSGPEKAKAEWPEATVVGGPVGTETEWLGSDSDSLLESIFLLDLLRVRIGSWIGTAGA